MKLTRQIGDVATEQLVANRAKEVVNKAGIAIPGPLELISIDEEKQHMDVNLHGRVPGIPAVLPIMRIHARGYIVNIGAGDVPRARQDEADRRRWAARPGPRQHAESTTAVHSGPTKQSGGGCGLTRG